MKNRRAVVRSKGRPMEVVTVPTMLRPTYAVPVSFDITTSGDVALPTFLVGHPHRVTSIRATVVANGAANGTCTIALANGLGSGSNGISSMSRTIVVGSAPTEIHFRNSKWVQHTISGATTIGTFGITNARLVGVIFVSVIGVV